MRIKNLTLKNIGPFLDDKLEFITDETKRPPVVIITGENGTGKTIVLDAIRALLFGSFAYINRNILREKNDFYLGGDLSYYDTNCNMHLGIEPNGDYSPKKDTGETYHNISSIFRQNNIKHVNWIANYWTSKSDNSTYNINNLKVLKPENFLIGALNGIQRNTEVTELITFFDYFRSSERPEEKKEGEFLYNIIKKIIKLSLIEGEFKYVERKYYMPIVSQNGFEVSLDKLSSGNLYLIQRLISLLGQMYSVYTLNNLPLEEMLHTPGLLLIDEAENHLHPKWQKTFLNSILDIFPNLQIIITTHSPFMISSVEDAKIFVCKSMRDHSVIIDETDLYSNKPIDEILLSEVFSTSPFNKKITELMDSRKKAIEQENNAERERIEKELKEINPEYFSYFDIDKLIESIAK